MWYVGEHNLLPGCLFYGIFRLSVILEFSGTNNTSIYSGLRRFMHEEHLGGESAREFVSFNFLHSGKVSTLEEELSGSIVVWVACVKDCQEARVRGDTSGGI